MTVFKTVCNVCGKEIEEGEVYIGFEDIYRPGNQTEYGWLELDLCHNCTEKLISACKISPIVTDNDIDDKDDYDDDYLD